MKFYDTSALLDLGAVAFEPASATTSSATASSTTEPFLIADMTLHELEEIKTSGKKSEEIRYKARTVTRLLAEHHDDNTFEAGLPEAQRQIQANIDSFKFVTSDLSCANIASGILYLPIEFTYPDAATNANNNYTG